VPLEECVIRRLAFIKSIYKIAIQQSEAPEPLCSASLLSFHDSVELFLYLALETLDATGSNKLNFIEYWEKISLKLSTDKTLSQKESMRRLNHSRVALKHFGTLPTKQDLDVFRVNVADFFNENTKIIFGIEFSDISLVELVSCSDAREALKEAESLLKDARTDDAMDSAAVAFAQLLDDYASKIKDRFGKYPFSFSAPSFTTVSFLSSNESDLVSDVESFADDVDSALSDIEDSISELQDALEIMMLCLDYRKYMKFYLLSPVVRKLQGKDDPKAKKTYGDYKVYEPKRRKKIPPTEDDVRFSIDFVIECALILQKLKL